MSSAPADDQAGAGSSLSWRFFSSREAVTAGHDRGRGPSGHAAAITRKLGDAGFNIEFAYTTFGGVKLVLGVDDLDKARAAG